MYLKSLTLRGFKSFASATTLRLEPGITCVVGPNGSGKSNILDGLSWVMGEQGAKSLRGGKMEDVIFAGTTSRAPLGRAEVTLTIDNTDGALPIDYAEVTISRLMFRSGQSEYSINGDSCRLLDVQDLLSDSGLGREMHVIVGQGQLDQILHAGPEARRAIIEEAAGVLKHRKRKEKALRKLDAMQANLTRLVDLTAELNRRLKPLGRQAEVARKAATIQADLRDARLRLLADDYLALRDKLEREVADEAAILARRTMLEASLAQARQQEAELDAVVATQAAELARAQQTWFDLSSLTERLRSVAGLANERARHLASDPEPERPGRDPDELDRQAEELRAEEAGLTERMDEGREALALAVAERTAVEGGLAHAERRLADAARAAAGRAERLARLRGMVDAARSRSAATGEEIDRLTAAAEQARGRAERAQLEYSEVQDVADGGDSDRTGLAAELDQAAKDHNHHSERTVASRKAERAANSEVAALRARVDALKETLRRGRGRHRRGAGRPRPLPRRPRLVRRPAHRRRRLPEGHRRRPRRRRRGPHRERPRRGGRGPDRHPRRQRRHRRPRHRLPVGRSTGRARPAPSAATAAAPATPSAPATQLPAPLAPRPSRRRAVGGRPGDRPGRAGRRGQRAARQRRGGSGPDRVGRVRQGSSRFSLRDRRRRPDRRALGARRVGRGAVAARRARRRR